MRLGVIADDFTGATDIAGFLQAQHMHTILYTGIGHQQVPPWAEALVVSLKIRSCEPAKAISEALSACEFLLQAGCDRFYYKYCSTFDSTEKGNIGPVADALMERLQEPVTIVCPALPVNGRTVYQGYLFVGSQLLSDSSMRYHPLNPMTDSKLMRLLGSQTKKKCAEIPYSIIARKSDCIAASIEQFARQGCSYIIVDTLDDTDLDEIAKATAKMKLVTGGSGLAIAIAHQHRLGLSHHTHQFVPSNGRLLMLSGSCSERTRQQLDYYSGKGPMYRLDPERCASDEHYLREVLHWLGQYLQEGPAPLIYALKDDSGEVPSADKELGSAIERVCAQIALHASQRGVHNFIVAGGETSGAVTKALHLDAFTIGPLIDPGVPWIQSLDTSYRMVLKSGNFGSIDFFEKAQTYMQAPHPWVASCTDNP